MDLQLFKYSALSSSSSFCISHNVLIKCALLGVNYNLHHHTALCYHPSNYRGYSLAGAGLYLLYFTSSLQKLPKSSHCPRRGGVAGRFRADAAHGARTIHTALSRVCVCVCQRAAASLLDRCFFKKKVFSFCGFGGLSLPLGPQYNHQRLQAAPLPGMECSSQGCYYFSCTALWQADTTFE